jgi:hypothetical protein
VCIKCKYLLDMNNVQRWNTSIVQRLGAKNTRVKMRKRGQSFLRSDILSYTWIDSTVSTCSTQRKQKWHHDHHIGITKNLWNTIIKMDLEGIGCPVLWVKFKWWGLDPIADRTLGGKAQRSECFSQLVMNTSIMWFLIFPTEYVHDHQLPSF